MRKEAIRLAVYLAGALGVTVQQIFGVLDSVPPWLFVAMAWVGVVLGLCDEGRRWLAHRREPLLGPLEVGEALLKEARDPNIAVSHERQSEFMAQVTNWVGEVKTLLGRPQDRERFERWTSIPWNQRGNPQPQDWTEAKKYLMDPLFERLAMLEDFCRERSDAR